MTHDTTKRRNIKDDQINFQALRDTWHEDQKKLIADIKALGYEPDVLKQSLHTILEDPAVGHEQNSALLSLKESFDELEARRKILWAEEDAVAELNKKHAAIHTDQFYILTEKQHPVFGGKDFTLESKESFKSQYEPYLIICSDGKQRSKAAIFLKSPLRRTYDGIVFDPIGDDELKRCYNIWSGFHKEARQGDASKYWDHLRDNICNGNEEAYLFVRKWLACIFQRPQEVHTALVIVGSQGVGKNSFVEPLGVLFGPHYVLLSSISELVSNFNFHLKNAVLIHANEALWGGHRKEVGALKAMITEKTCLIEGKGKDRIMVKNFKHLILSSNESWPVHLDRDDRRFFVLQASERHKEDHAYFAALQEQLDHGGYEALLYDLLHEKLDGFNPRRFPHSTISFDIKMISQDSVVRYIHAALSEGHFCVGDETEGFWQPEIPKNLVYQDYAKWCINNGEAKLQNHQFGKWLNKLVPSIKSIRIGSKNERISAYKLPPLEIARKEFCKAFNEQETIFALSNEEWDRL